MIMVILVSSEAIVNNQQANFTQGGLRPIVFPQGLAPIKFPDSKPSDNDSGLLKKKLGKIVFPSN